MNFPKPPEPPQPPPPPPSDHLFPHLYTVYYKKNNSTNLRFLKDFQSTIYEQFKKMFISKPSNKQQNIPKCKKINSETLMELASDKKANINRTKANKKVPLRAQSNQTEPHHVIRIPSFPSIETSSFSSTNSIILERKGVSFSSNNSSNINVYRPLFTNSTFYLINIFLFIVCVITLLLFIFMISLMSRKCNRKKIKNSKSGVSSASSSASSISFIACYTTSDSSLHSLKSLSHIDSNRKFNLDSELQKDMQTPQTGLKTSLSNLKKKTFKTGKERSVVHSPSKYYTITDSFFEKNFQLRKPLARPLEIKSNLCFANMSTTNEYDEIIPDNFFNTNNTSLKCFNYPRAEYLPPLNQHQTRLNPVYHQNGFLSGRSEYVRPIDLCSMNVCPLPIASFENYYTIDQKSIYVENSRNLNLVEAYKSNCNLDFSNMITDGSSTSTTEHTTDRKKFPRTNPMCRNLNYYTCKVNQSDGLNSEESIVSKL